MKERSGTYWICDLCAIKRGWEHFKSFNTVIKGLCGHCDSQQEETLTPTRDFKKPRRQSPDNATGGEMKPRDFWIYWEDYDDDLNKNAKVSDTPMDGWFHVREVTTSTIKSPGGES